MTLFRFAAVAAFCSASLSLMAQTAATVTTVPVAGPVYMLEGSGGNMAVVVGDDGFVLIDAKYANAADAVKQQLAQLKAGAKVNSLINTHFHGDHVSGNAALAAGLPIIASDNTGKRLAQDSKFDRKGLPTDTFSGEKTWQRNGVTMQLVTQAPSHTDTDLVVWFKDLNTVHMGDLFFVDRFPFIDLKSGGSVAGYINNIKALLNKMDDKTQIIPGHGALSHKADLQRFLAMIEQTQAQVLLMKQQGLSEDQAVQKGLGETWQSWSWQFINEEKWIRTLYQGSH